MALIQDKSKKENAIIKSLTATEKRTNTTAFINAFKEAYPDDVRTIVEFYKKKEKDNDKNVDSCLLDYFSGAFRKKQVYFTDYVATIKSHTKREQLRGSDDIETIKNVLKDTSGRNFQMRLAAIQALSKIHTTEATNLLRGSTKDPMNQIRRTAYGYLKKRDSKPKRTHNK